METKKSEVTKDNFFKATGKIVNYYETGSVFIVSLMIPGHDRKGAFIASYPKIYFFKNDNTDIGKFMLHDHVQIEGHVAAPRKKRANGNEYFSQALIGDKIVANQFFEQPSTLVYLHGDIRKVEQVAKNVTNITLNARNRSFNNYITITSFSKDAMLNAPGDEISVYANVITSRKERNGKAFFYENVVARRIVNEKNEKADKPNKIKEKKIKAVAPAEPVLDEVIQKDLNPAEDLPM